MTGNRRILIIGGVAAGTSAASKARRTDPNADIKIIQEEPVVSYGACGMPYVIEGLIDGFNRLIARPAERFKDKYNIDIITNTRAVKIDGLNKKVYAENVNQRNNGNEYSDAASKQIILDYDSLVIATGARSAIPMIKGIFVNEDASNDVKRSSKTLKGLLLLRNYGDGIHVQDSIRDSKSCVIVGAGLIGVEMAEAFRRRGMDVTIVEMSDRVLPSLLNEDMSDMVKRELEDNGVKVVLGEGLKEIVTSSSPPLHSSSSSSHEVRYLERVKTTKNKEIATDLVLLGTGVLPNSQIAKNAGIQLGVHDAIRVDEYMRTNIPDIFAAGDCATVRNYITNKDVYLPLGTTANKQGRVAGENAAGGKVEFKGVAGSVITKTFDLYVGKTGLDKQEASENGFDPVEKEIKSVTRAGYYPNKKSILIRLVADKKSRRILGTQIIGGEAVKGRIDLIAFALLIRATVDDLASYDACYVPPVSPVWEPINIAASQTAKLFVE